MSASATDAAAREFASRIRRTFGPRLTQLALFGSYARGEARPDSDVDILVVVDDATRADAVAVDEIVGDILTKTDVLLSPLFLTTARFAELRARERLVVAEIERDGVSL